MKKTILQRFFLSLCLMIVGCLWGSAAWAQTTVTDVLTASDFTATGSTYTVFSGVKGNKSDAIYAGQSAKSKSGAIQLRSKNSNSGIVTTTSGGKVRKIVLTWNSETGANQIVEIYGSNTSYASAVDLYNSGKRGTSLGSIKNGTTEFTVTGDYKYFGLRSKDGAVYLDQIEVTYEVAGSVSSVPSPTFSLASGTYYGNQTLELSSTVDGGTIYYTTDDTDPSESETATEYTTNPINLTAPSTLTVKAIVMDSEGNFSNVASHTYNILTSIANTQETALTTAEAISLINATTAEQLAAEKVYVRGTISKVDSYNSTNKSITYWLDDNKFEVYSGRGLDNADFSAKTDIEVGADVIIYGNIKKFNSTYEFDKNNYLVSYSVAAKTLESVTISGTPTQTTYEVGEAFNTAGLTVTAHYSDGSSKEITSGITWNVTPETLTAGVISVSVTATVDEVTSKAFIINGITVRALQSVTLEGFPTKTSYSVGEIFDPTGIIVKANYSNSDSEDVTAEATFNYDHNTLTTNTTSMTVTATFGGMTSAEQNYTITVLKNIVPFAPKAIYRKVTSTDAVRDGGVYLIVCEGFDEIMGSLDTKNQRCTSVSATIADLHTYEGEVNVEGKPYEITVSKAKDGSYNLYHAGGKYINASTTTDLVFEDSGKGGWSFSFVKSTGNVKISNTKKPNNYIQRHGETANNFYRNYANGQKVVQLYQKVGEISVAKATGGITTFASNCDYIMPENLTGYIVTEAAKTGTITTKAVYHAGEAVPAYTPLIIKSREDYTEEETAKTYNPIALNKGLSYTGETNMLEYNRNASGYTETTKGESVYYYKLAIKDGKVGFYWGATGGAAFEMTKPSTAYLTVPQEMAVQGFVLNLEEGETTGIATVVTNEDAPIYNLQGIRMNGKNLPKGIYIQGGKKFMVK
ncbi:MAG: chitobiase/beta-hexosaminidase C-terminal domain-containing protein [Bacteroidales bacterium]|nr:chitobiase/beta-hexosaminidase C-terminal domain-containing protein [Bacteroidales bacterium]MDY2704774.1 chitobiase/beta-hexosaminidase C-terminal domain-containing protein [Alloprevotella sp.]